MKTNHMQSVEESFKNSSTVSNGASAPTTEPSPPNGLARRSFIRGLGIAAGLLAGGGIGAAQRAFAQDGATTESLTPDDVAILRFLAAAEIIETDLWQQYTELATGNPAYAEALEVLDDEMPQYIIDNTDDEHSHASFLNAYLKSKGAPPVNLDAFRTLPSSQATGAAQIGRLTNLTQLTVDTSWWIRYRTHKNPDFGDTFPQFINIVNFPAIPSHDLPKGSKKIQAIANTAAFHFATIEQGGSSLYASFVPKANRHNTLRILAAIGGTEVFHFAIWHDKAGNAPAVSVPGVTFPDMESFEGDSSRQKDLIMPEPCRFLELDLPDCSVIRPSLTQNAGAMAAAMALTKSGLFIGQSNAFLNALHTLASAADNAQRHCS
jgi:hypothetical protein